MNIPKGYKLVPVEPTDDMIVAFAEAWYSKRQAVDDPMMEDAYRDMLAAAPTPPQTVYDEAKERELFKEVYFRCDLSEDWLSGAFKDKQTRDMWDGWRECAQSRAKVVEVTEVREFEQRQEPGSGSVSRNTFHNTGGTYGADLIGTGLTEVTVTSGFEFGHTEESLKSDAFAPFAWWCWNPGMGPNGTDGVFVTPMHPKEQTVENALYGYTNCKVVADQPLYRAEDFDRVTAERDALQALLTAADERADAAIALLECVLDTGELTREKHLELEADICQLVTEFWGDRKAARIPSPPRCPDCGYTEQDCREHMDHHLCGSPEPAPARKP